MKNVDQTATELRSRIAALEGMAHRAKASGDAIHQAAGERLQVVEKQVAETNAHEKAYPGLLRERAQLHRLVALRQ